MKAFLDMVGCRLNQAEIDKLALDLALEGYQVVPDAQEADVIIVNTCCVTAKAAADSKKMIRHYQNKAVGRVVAMGCWPSAFENDAKALVGEANVLLNDQKDLPFDLFAEASPVSRNISSKPDLGPRNRTRAFIKVQDGCNNRCSYCLTRIARGPARSYPVNDVIGDINRMVELGVKEVVLTGVQIGAWRSETGDGLERLIETILKETDIPRIRISSIEPWEVTDQLIDMFGNSRLCPQLHIPLQSGTDKILRRMQRPGSAEQYRSLLFKLASNKPSISVTTDIIVGFPGETEADFEETLNFVKNSSLVGGHVFRFSPMPGTPAATLDLRVSEKEKKVRSAQLIQMLDDKHRSFLESLVGNNAQVLWEGSKTVEGVKQLSGLSQEGARVLSSFQAELINQITPVRLVSLGANNFIQGVRLPDTALSLSFTNESVMMNHK